MYQTLHPTTLLFYTKTMVKCFLLLLLAWSLRTYHKPALSYVLYAICITVYIFLSSAAPFTTTILIALIQCGLGALYAWMLHKITLYIGLEGGFFWWVAIGAGALIGVI